MTTKRNIGRLLAILGLVVADLLPDSAVAEGVRYGALAYMAVDFFLQARTGYLRRRPHWTSESWRRYRLACAVPVGALLVVVALMFALEWRLPIVGAARSSVRGVWAAGTVVLMMFGAVGLAVVIGWLANGEPSQQFVLPKWLRRRSGEAA